MRKHSFLLLSALVLFLNTGFSCGESFDEKDPEIIDLQSIEIYNLNNAGETPVIVENNVPIPKEAYAIRIRPIPQQKLSENGYYQLYDKITRIEVIDISNNIDVSEYFRIIPNQYSNGNTELSKYNVYIFNGYPADIDIALLTLLKAGEQRFAISLILESGRKLSAVTPITTLY